MSHEIDIPTTRIANPKASAEMPTPEVSLTPPAADVEGEAVAAAQPEATAAEVSEPDAAVVESAQPDAAAAEAPEGAPDAASGQALDGSGMLLPPLPSQMPDEGHEADPALLQEFPWLTDVPDAADVELDDMIVPGIPETAAPIGTCVKCGGDVDADGYCIQCGARMATEREHYRETPAAWVAGVCDRGLVHAANEDALATAADETQGSHAVLIVCDGVSASTGSDVAAMAAAQAARDALDASRPEIASDVIVAQNLRQAIVLANNEVVEHTNPESPSPASCTFVGAVVTNGVISVANIGDSRAYWVGEDGQALQLSTDHSLAQEAIAEGIERAIAENAPGAHTLTRWLGLDSPALAPSLATYTPEGPGWLVVCSDGLWNYASEASVLAELVAGKAAEAGPALVDVAAALVDWANEQGGHDNISVALARIGDPVVETAVPAEVVEPAAMA